MKKTILAILLCGVMVFGITGCGNSKLSPKGNIKIEIEIIEMGYDNKIIEVSNNVDINKLENILTNSKYDDELCKGVITHKIKLNDEVYYLKEDCKALQKGNKQVTLSNEYLNTIIEIINNYK